MLYYLCLLPTVLEGMINEVHVAGPWTCPDAVHISFIHKNTPKPIRQGGNALIINEDVDISAWGREAFLFERIE